MNAVLHGLSEALPAMVPRPPGRLPSPPLRTILIAGSMTDQPASGPVQTAVRRALGTQIRVLTAFTRAELAEAVSSRQVDVALVPERFGDADGMALCAALGGRFAPVPLLLLRAGPAPDQAKTPSAVQDVLWAEDLTPRLLIRSLTQALDYHHLHQSLTGMEERTGQLLQHLGHNVRTPLFAILGLSTLLRTPSADGSLPSTGEVVSHMDAIHDAALSLRAALDQVEALARDTPPPALRDGPATPTVTQAETLSALIDRTDQFHSEKTGDTRPPLEGLRLLVVDDNPLNRLILTRMLEPTGALVDVAESGAEAMLCAMAHPYDGVLLDIMMPDISGLTVARRLRREPGPNQATAIIACTATCQAEQNRRYLAAGMTAVLPKPLVAAELIACVARHCPPRPLACTSAGCR